MGKATATFKLAVSVQIVLRALIDEGVKRPEDRALLANVEGQAKAVRHLRSVACQRWRIEEGLEDRRSDIESRPDGGEQPRQWK